MIRLPSSRPLFALLSVAVLGCAPASTPTRNGIFVKDLPGLEQNEAPPACEGAPREIGDADRERGVQPFDSKSALEASVGSTVYVIDSRDLGPATKGGKRRWFHFGEPLFLCRAKPLRNPGLVVSEEVFYANNVLTKDRDGHLYSVPIEMLSQRAPRFSVDAPGSAEETLLGAFSEARAAMDALGDRKPQPGVADDRDSKAFWADKVDRALTATKTHGKEIVHRIVTGRPPAGKGPTFECKIESRECKADGTRWFEASADPKLGLWYTRGIDDGGQRDAYASLYECLKSDKQCDEARSHVSSPVKPTGATTLGGKLVITVNPAKDAANATLEVDGKPVKIVGNVAEVTFEKDGSHEVRASAPGKRALPSSKTVKEGRTFELNVVLLPGSN